MTELTDSIHRAVEAIEQRASAARDEVERRGEAREIAKADFETIKKSVVRPVLLDAVQLLGKSRVIARVEERKDAAHQDDHIRLVIEPPEKRLHPGSSTLVFGRGHLDGVDITCFHRGTDNSTEHFLKTKHLSNSEVTPAAVESILAQVVRLMIDPAAPTR